MPVGEEHQQRTRRVQVRQYSQHPPLIRNLHESLHPGGEPRIQSASFSSLFCKAADQRPRELCCNRRVEADRSSRSSLRNAQHNFRDNRLAGIVLALVGAWLLWGPLSVLLVIGG